MFEALCRKFPEAFLADARGPAKTLHDADLICTESVAIGDRAASANDMCRSEPKFREIDIIRYPK
ncbi:hypothetical protein NK8_83910 (plasmid) [Caballeronia sp. NK8]|nr:hypothetical protein NK8_83910 [Caballeronia sp. NK8]